MALSYLRILALSLLALCALDVAFVFVHMSTSGGNDNNNHHNHASHFLGDPRHFSQKIAPSASDGGAGVTVAEEDATAATAAAPPPSDAKATIAYAVSITSCDGSSSNSLMMMQGAAILAHSIRLSSFRISSATAADPSSRSSSSTRGGSKYASVLYAFVLPEAESCSYDLRRLGYRVLIRDVPVNVSDIRNSQYREGVYKQSCCGPKEFLKLYSYTLTDYPIVVHLDLDTMVLKPMDDLFDAMIDDVDEGKGGGNNDSSIVARRRMPVMFNATLPKKIDAYFTRDYNMVNPGKEIVGMQGGFLIVRPNLQYFEEYKEIILEGNFVPGQGWDGKWGGFFG